MAGDIPAGIIVAVGEERTSTGHIFFRLISVHLQIEFAVLVGNREHAIAMDRTSGGTEFRINNTKGVREKVDGVDQNAQRDDADENPAEQNFRMWRGTPGDGGFCGLSSHGWSDCNRKGHR